MSDKAISRQAALVSIKNLYPDMPIVDIMSARQKWLEKYAPYFECENVIEHLPLISPKTAHWIWEHDEHYGTDIKTCSECGASYQHFDFTNYCPNCGKRMIR